jgi:hypothetical protein
VIQGTCLGWGIESDLSFHFLRAGESAKTLRVDEWDPGPDPAGGGDLLVRWRQRPDRPFHGSVHRMVDRSLIVETSDAGWFRMWPEAHRVEVPQGVDPVSREVRLLTTPMLLLTTFGGETPLHAACVEIGGRPVAISAPGGFGKTTLAAALVGRGHGLLGEDITVTDGAGSVVPGPDLLRLRPDVVAQVGQGRLQVVHETSDRVMVRTNTPAPEPLPLAAVVFLKVGAERELSRRLDDQRIADLWQVSFHLPNMTDRARAFDAVVSLADRVPIYDLSRPLDWDTLEWSMDKIEDVAR